MTGSFATLHIIIFQILRLLSAASAYSVQSSTTELLPFNTFRLLLQAHNATDVVPWGELLANSYIFYEAQQSGVLPDWNRVRVELPGGWRSNSHVTDGADINANLSGGYYDAGDHMKYLVPMTHVFTTLGMGALFHEAGYRSSGQWDYMARVMRYATDWLIKAHLVASDVPAENVMVTQVGDTGIDHSYWGRPEQQAGPRPTKTTRDAPAADIMGNTAAVFAAAAMIFDKPGAYQDHVYASQLLIRARQLLAAGDAMPGTWQDPAYASSNYKDEMALGYLMVCKADLRSPTTALPASCTTALARYAAAHQELQYNVNWDWDSKLMGASLLLLSIAPQITAANGNTIPPQVSAAQDYVLRTLAIWQNRSNACPATNVGPGWFQVCYTPGGLAFLTQWGTLRHASNMAFAATIQAKLLAANGQLTAARQQRCWARSQLLYAAGNNPIKQSYIIGYAPPGTVPADRPHHRSSSCSKNYSVPCTFDQLYAPGPNPNVLVGALVGGPDNLDNFDNRRENYVQNEVALDYNAGFTGALAGLYEVSQNLAAAGCTWDSYCGGTCEAAADITPATPVTDPDPDPDSNVTPQDARLPMPQLS